MIVELKTYAVTCDSCEKTTTVHAHSELGSVSDAGCSFDLDEPPVRGNPAVLCWVCVAKKRELRNGNG